MPTNKKQAHAAAQRRYRAKHWLRVRGIEKAYRNTPAGRAKVRAQHRRYQRTPKGRAAQQRARGTSYAAWLESPRGRRYTEKHNLRLPPFAPASFVRSIRLLGALKQEIRT